MLMNTLNEKARHIMTSSSQSESRARGPAASLPGRGQSGRPGARLPGGGQSQAGRRSTRFWSNCESAPLRWWHSVPSIQEANILKQLVMPLGNQIAETLASSQGVTPRCLRKWLRPRIRLMLARTLLLMSWQLPRLLCSKWAGAGEENVPAGLGADERQKAIEGLGSPTPFK